jgi:DNA polymerase-3 subunit delta'
VVVDAEGRWPLPWQTEPLRDALRRQRGHALLVQSASDRAAWHFMLTLAQGWLCEATDALAAPCGRCGSCRLVLAHAHPDLHLLLPEARRAQLPHAPAADDDADSGRSKRKPSRQIRIDEVRAAIDWATRSSSRGRAKVVVLHPAEAMSVQTASALLKTLEEPPGQARLLLGTADAAQLLPTVRSRCQRIVLQSPDADAAVAWLELQGLRDAAVLLAAAGGQPLEAQELAAAGIDAARWLALPQAVAAGQASALAQWPVPRVVDALQKLCHDALAAAVGGRTRFFPGEALPPGGLPQALLDWARSLAGVARHDEHPWNEPLLLDALVAEGRACWADATRERAGRAPALATLRR